MCSPPAGSTVRAQPARVSLHPVTEDSALVANSARKLLKLCSELSPRDGRSRPDSASDLRLDPAAYDVEDLPSVRLEHHEVTVSEDPAVFQLHVLDAAACLLQKFDRRRRRSPRRLRPSRSRSGCPAGSSACAEDRPEACIPASPVARWRGHFARRDLRRIGNGRIECERHAREAPSARARKRSARALDANHCFHEVGRWSATSHPNGPPAECVTMTAGPILSINSAPRLALGRHRRFVCPRCARKPAPADRCQVAR